MSLARRFPETMLELLDRLVPEDPRPTPDDLAGVLTLIGDASPKRVSRLNPEAEWMRKEVPQLRIVSDELWAHAKRRQELGRHAVRTAGNPVGARRPQYLFSGLTKCGVCGAGFIMTGKHRLGCFGARDQGRCDNHLTIRRDEVETRVLRARQEKLLNQELFAEFCDEFTREMNRLRMECRATLSSAKREVERIGTRIKKLLNLLLDERDRGGRGESGNLRRSTLAGRSSRRSWRPRTSRRRSSIRRWPSSTGRRLRCWLSLGATRRPVRKPRRRSEGSSTPSS
jgi:Recombinase zinc beta ribbon domain